MFVLNARKLRQMGFISFQLMQTEADGFSTHANRGGQVLFVFNAHKTTPMGYVSFQLKQEADGLHAIRKRWMGYTQIMEEDVARADNVL